MTKYKIRNEKRRGKYEKRYKVFVTYNYEKYVTKKEYQILGSQYQFAEVNIDFLEGKSTIKFTYTNSKGQYKYTPNSTFDVNAQALKTHDRRLWVLRLLGV